MWRRPIQLLLGDTHCGDDRVSPVCDAAPSEGAVPAATTKPPIFRRRTINIIFAIGIAVILYGTLMPFALAPDRSLSWSLAWHSPDPNDTMTNVMIYVPIGMFLRLTVRRRGSSRTFEWLVAVSVAVGLSYLTEVMQTVIQGRVACWTDVVCNAIGATIGIALGPMTQRALRNIHAWLFCQMRLRPMASAAAMATWGLCVYALAPLDLRPTAAHLTEAFRHWWSAQAGLWWFGLVNGVTTADVLNKLVAAGGYGVLAFILLLSAREEERSLPASCWYALSRSAALVCVVEMFQLFTVSHVADPRDLISAWTCCAFGALIGWRLVTAWPELHRRPILLLRGLVIVAAAGTFVWALGTVGTGQAVAASSGTLNWLPGVRGFHRPWNSLLGDYTTSLLQYSLIGALVVLWSRSARRRPARRAVVGVPLVTAILMIGFSQITRGGGDTTHLLLALLGGAIAVYFDRVVFTRRTVATATATSGG